MLEAFTLILAVATVALAGATVWSAMEQGWREDRRVVRAALLEQYSNARRWSLGRPGLRTKQAARLASDPTPTTAVEEFIIRLELPEELTAYFVWLSARVAQDQGEYSRVYPESQQNTGARDVWMSQLDNLQSIVQLIALCSDSRRALRGAAQSFTSATWLVPHAGPPNLRDSARAQQEAQWGRPPFPSDPTFAPAHPHARDVAAYGSEEALATVEQSPGIGVPTAAFIPSHSVGRHGRNPTWRRPW